MLVGEAGTGSSSCCCTAMKYLTSGFTPSCRLRPVAAAQLTVFSPSPPLSISRNSPRRWLNNPPPSPPISAAGMTPGVRGSSPDSSGRRLIGVVPPTGKCLQTPSANDRFISICVRHRTSIRPSVRDIHMRAGGQRIVARAIIGPCDGGLIDSALASRQRSSVCEACHGF
jgi:hypothetical protein